MVKAVAGVLALMMACWSGAADAQTNTFLAKDKVVQLIVPYPPGGPTDLGGRLFADALSSRLGIQIRTINKPGANGAIGVQELLRNPADGTTIAFVSTYATAASYLNEAEKVSYKRSDLMPVALALFDPNLFFVPANSKFTTLKQLLEHAKTNSSRLKFATSGALSSGALFGLLIEQDTGAKFSFVPYSGAAPIATALAAGDVDVAPISAVPARPFLESGKIRLISVVDDDAAQDFPNVPTASSEGYRMESLTNYGFLLPNGVPETVANGWDEAIREALKEKMLAAKLGELGLKIKYKGRPEYQSYWNEVEQKTARVLTYLHSRKE